MRTKIIYGLIIAVLLTAALWSPAVHDLASKPTFVKPILVGLVGTAEAVTADYICDGTDDQAQLQAALNALPASGGELVLLAGTYSVSATVTLPINNIKVSGLGDSTYVTYDASTPVFSAAGKTGCTFSDFKTDAGWLTLGTNTALINMNNNGTRTSTINGVTLSANSANATGYFSGNTLISTVATGTPPLTVNSTTNVTNLNADLLDGYHASFFAAGTGNVTAVGMTSGYVPLSTSTTGITNSIMTGNGTILSIPIVTGAELAPTIAAANWTGGAGWTVGVGTLTRVASAVTTTYPTVAIVPSTTANYLVTFTISSWTAGTVTMTLGGVESTPMQGNQNVYLYVSPYTTGNIIFTPSATFAGVISAVSVKVYTGGEIYIDGGVLYYDSRGHPNRLSHVTRHLNEMTMDTLLDKSLSTLTCAGGVLTYTLYAVYGQETWNFNGIVYPGAVASASVALTGGTDAAPKTNWVYFDLDGNTPRLATSTTAEPTTTHIMVAEFIVGAVSGSSYTIYGYNRARTEVDSFVKRVIGRFENSGSLYVEGALPTVNATAISVASGGKWYQGIFEMTSANTVVAPTAFFYTFSNGTYAQATSLASLNKYSDGSSTGGGGTRVNVVWGIVPTTTTAGGTLPTTVRLVAVLQSKPTSDYGSVSAAEQDVYDATNYYPPDTQLKEVFVPIARTILRPSTGAFEAFGSGLYWRDLRGKTSYGGGSATSMGDMSGYLLLDGTRPMTGNLNMGTTGNITMAAGMTVDGVDISTLSGGSGNVTVTTSTAGYIPKFGTTTNIVNSIMSESGSTVTATGNVSASRLISTVAVGIAPFTVTSTTNVTNLNADYVDGYHMNQDTLTTSSPTFTAMTLSQADGTKPMTITSTTNVTNLNADLWDGLHSTSLTYAGIQFVIDGGGSAITTGIKGDLEIPFDCAIDRADAFADTTGNITVSIWKSTYAGFAPTSTANITASAPVTITSAVKSQDSTLTGWTKTIAGDSILRFNVDSCAAITRVTISLRVRRQ